MNRAPLGVHKGLTGTEKPLLVPGRSKKVSRARKALSWCPGGGPGVLEEEKECDAGDGDYRTQDLLPGNLLMVDY